MSDLGWDAKEGLKLRRTSLAAQQSSVNVTPVLRETQGLALNLRIMELDAVSREQFNLKSGFSLELPSEQAFLPLSVSPLIVEQETWEILAPSC